MANDSILIQVQLGAPTRANINAVTRQIQSALSNVSANVQISNGRQAAQTLQNIKNKTDASTKSMNSFGEAIGLSARRFVAFTSAVAVVGRLTSALSQATREAIKFEREFVKLAQVFDTDVRSLKSLENSMSNLAQEFGLSATVIAKTSVILAQSGLNAKQTEQAMRTLAKTTLAATFDSIASSTEGAVAIMSQFGTEASKLETQLGAINAVSKRFAVESGDIIEAVRRAGGAFRAAGGNLNDFIALFTAVRSTTRESAETIATGFRTIFARIQRPRTIEFFRQLNIELTDGRGNFIGAFEAVKRLSDGLQRAGIEAGSLRFAEVVEQLGGIRQVSRVIPLIQQFTKAERARQVAVAGGGSLDKDAAKAQETLSQAFARTTENFRALIREISQTATFQAIVRVALDLANAFIEVARALKPLIPIIAAFGAIKLGRGAFTKFVGGAGGTGGLGQGFKRGGPVPGTGSGDTVPAMLEPGEFVIRKSAVQAFGADRLAGINKYAPGGKVRDLATRSDTSKQLENAVVDTPREPFNKGAVVNSNDEFLANVIRKFVPINQAQADSFRTKTRLSLDSLDKQEKGDAFEKYLIDKRITTIPQANKKNKNYPVDFANPSSGRYAEAKNSVGRISDQHVIDKLWRARVADGTYGKRKQIPTEEGNQKIDLGSIRLFQIQRNYTPRRKQRQLRLPFSAGGAVGTDTVPALLTPGEFVVNKKSAEAFGYGNLGKINKYAKGGPVKRFNLGGKATAQQAQAIINASDLDEANKVMVEGAEHASEVIADSFKTLPESVQKIIQDTFQGVQMVSGQEKFTRPSGTEDRLKVGVKGRAALSKGELTASSIALKKGEATVGAAKHEGQHIKDKALGQAHAQQGTGETGQYASMTPGTFQFDIVEKVKPHLEKAFKEAGEDSKRISEYLADNREIFANFGAHASPAVRQILDSLDSSEKSMAKLKGVLFKEGETFAGLSASDIDIKRKKPKPTTATEVGKLTAAKRKVDAGTRQATDQGVGQGMIDAAQKALEEAEAAFERLSKRKPQDQGALAVSRRGGVGGIEAQKAEIAKRKKVADELVVARQKELKVVQRGVERLKAQQKASQVLAEKIKKAKTKEIIQTIRGGAPGGPGGSGGPVSPLKKKPQRAAPTPKQGSGAIGLGVTAVALQGLAGSASDLTGLFGVQSKALDETIQKMLTMASILVTLNSLYQTQLGQKLLGGLGGRLKKLFGGPSAGSGLAKKLGTPLRLSKSARVADAAKAAKLNTRGIIAAIKKGGAASPASRTAQTISKIRAQGAIGSGGKAPGITKSIGNAFKQGRGLLSKGLASSAVKTGLGIAKALGPQIALFATEFALKATGVFKDITAQRTEAIERGDAAEAVDLTETQQGQDLLNTMVIAGTALTLLTGPIGATVAVVGLLGRAVYDNAQWFDDITGTDLGTSFVGMIDTAVNWIDSYTGWATEAREAAKSAALVNKAQISTTQALANFDRQLKLGDNKKAVAGLEVAAGDVQSSLDFENRAVQGSFSGNLANKLSFGLLGSSTEDQEAQQAEAAAKTKEQEQRITKKVIDSGALNATVQSIIDAGGSYEEFADKLAKENPQLFNLLNKSGELSDAFEITKKKALAINFENFQKASEALLAISKGKFDRDSQIRSLTGGKTGRKEFDDFTKEQSGIINFGLNNLQGGGGGGANAFGGDVSTAEGLTALISSAQETASAIEVMRSGASAAGEVLEVDLNGNGQKAALTLGQAEELQKKQNLAIQQSLGLAKQRLQVIQQEIQARNANIKTLNNFVTDFAFSSGKDKRQKTQQFASAQTVAAELAVGKTVGEIQGVSQADKQASKALFEQFGDVAIFGGKTGKEVLGDARVAEFGGSEAIIAEYGKEQGEQIIHALREGTVSESDKMIKEMSDLNKAINQAELENVQLFNEGAKLFADSVMLQASVQAQESKTKKLTEEQKLLEGKKVPEAEQKLKDARAELRDTEGGMDAANKVLEKAKAGKLDYNKTHFSNLQEVQAHANLKTQQHEDQKQRVVLAEQARNNLLKQAKDIEIQKSGANGSVEDQAAALSRRRDSLGSSKSGGPPKASDKLPDPSLIGTSGRDLDREEKIAQMNLEAANKNAENIKNMPTNIKSDVIGTFNLNGSENMTGEALKSAGEKIVAMGDEKIKTAARMNETGQDLPPAGTPIPIGSMS